ncbi:hypothetical protein PACTADRAFT_38938 [Pachysolen tannophilus NRRL Y-2460]|uniref:Proteasome subunit beta n=1 Tax=Pachysolen tannophilus NRRL Y-2460 TaxID=669874 RepID=A0A1E4U058_PACTA|nr:hypothetical protein PACTADRAFT_38938 [Pachysolen tannophilus NRRL Y-2460]
MNHDPFAWGRPLNETYGEYNYNIANASSVTSHRNPKMATQQPIVTGSSVLAIKFKDGVIMAADNLASYGSLARFDNVERLLQVGKDTIVGCSGDISDFQKIERLLDDLEIEDGYDIENYELKANHIHEYLSRVFYNRRSKMDPLWNSCLVGGFDADSGEPFLKYVDLLGVTYGADSLATGFGSHLAIPLLRKKLDSDDAVKNLTEEEGIKLISECMKVLYYRDARSLDKYSLAIIKKDDVKLIKGLRCEDMSWRFASGIRGYGN